MPSHRCQFIWFVADSTVVRNRNPSTPANCFEPFLVRRIRSEVVDVALDHDATCSEDLGEASAEVAIGEKDLAQAARSYKTACSISPSVNP